MSQIVINTDGTVAVGLQRPLATDGMPPVTYVRLAPVTAEQIERWADADFESTFELLGEMAELPEKTVAQLGGADLSNVMLAFNMLITPPIRTDFENARFPLVSGYRRKSAPVTVLEEPEAAMAEPPQPPQPQPQPQPQPPPPPQPAPPPPADFKGPVVIPTKRTHPLPPNPKDPRYPDISKMRVDESGAVVGIAPPSVMERVQ